MDINKLTIGEARDISAMFGDRSEGNPHPYSIGDNWFFRTVTHHLIGEIKSVGKQEIVLRGGTVLWVADDGRFTQLFENGEPTETEVYGKEDVVIGRGSIIDATRIKINIQVVQK